MSNPVIVLTSLVATAVSLARPALAQEPALHARNFFHDDYRTVFCLDMKAVRDTGVWDELALPPVKMIGQLMQEQLGFSLERLDRVTSVRARYDFEDGSKRFRDVTSIEGNGDLGQPAEVGRGDYTPQKVGAHTLLCSKWDDGAGVVAVHDRLRVSGPVELLTDVLSGRPRAGLPSADVMSLMAGHARMLLYFVMDLQAEDVTREMLHEVLPGATWQDEEAPTFLCGRLRATGDEDDPHMLLELVLRHGKAGDGIAVTERAVAAAIEKLKGQQQARMFLPVLQRITHERDGVDVTWRVDLGRAREFGGMLGMLVPFLFLASSAEPVVMPMPVAVPAVPAEVEPAAEPGKKKDDKKK